MRHPAVACCFYWEKSRSQLPEPDIRVLNQSQSQKNRDFTPIGVYYSVGNCTCKRFCMRDCVKPAYIYTVV